MNRAFKKLYFSHHSYLYRIAYRIVRDTHAAKDIVQHVFLKIWERSDTLDLNDDLKSYLIKATINASLDYIERQKNSVKIEQEAQIRLMDNENPVQDDFQRHFEEALLKLPEKCRAVFILNKLEGLRYKEIAAYMDISEKTVENQMGKALKVLRELLSKYKNE